VIGDGNCVIGLEILSGQMFMLFVLKCLVHARL